MLIYEVIFFDKGKEMNTQYLEYACSIYIVW